MGKENLDEDFDFDDLMAGLPARSTEELAPRLSTAELKPIMEAQLLALDIDPKGIKLPKLSIIPELHGKQVLLVDDSADVFRKFVPYLVVATNGEANFIRYRAGSAGDLAKKILAANPDIALLDGQLGEKVRGWDVVSLVHKANPRLLCVGFSAEATFDRAFTAAGAMGFVHKRVDAVEDSMAVLIEQARILLTLDSLADIGSDTSLGDSEEDS
ncbi:MAG: hypothetical protein J0M12_06915 [Deltaproteobacteria bacterium]|nr:hypothetical protein [Deltaproteobacteria bacterium]